jgi:50S ribosomal subunit-associated GTPase HflX
VKEREDLRDDARTVHVSALKGLGLGALLERIDQTLEEDPLRQVHLRVPQSEGKALAMLEAGARIYVRHYRDGIVEMEAQAPESLVRKIARFAVDVTRKELENGQIQRDSEFHPIEIRGAPLSDTVLRERRRK